MAYKFQLGNARLSGSIVQEGDIFVSGSDPEMALRDNSEQRRFVVDYNSNAVRVRLKNSAGANQVKLEEAGNISGSATISGFAGDFESSVDALGGFNVGGSAIISSAKALANVTTISGSGEISGASIDVDGEVDAGSLEIGATEVISSARAVANITSVTMNGALAGATTVSGSSNAQFGGTLASSHGKFTVDADGDLSAKSLNARSGGISNAGAIAGATTLAMGGALSGATTISGSGALSGLSLDVEKGADFNSGGLTNAGAISGATTLAMGGALSGATTISGSSNLSVGGTIAAGNSNFTVSAAGNMVAASGSITDLFVGDDLHVADDARIEGDLTAASLAVDSVSLNANIMAGLSQLTSSEISASAIYATHGYFSANSLVVGSTTISETEIAMLDGLTLGSVDASKIVSADSNKDVSGFRHVSGSGNLTFGGVLQAGLGGFGVDADGDTTVKSLNASNGGITNAGAISGATSLAMGGALSGATTVSGSGNFSVGGALSVANSGVNSRDGYQVGGTGVISSARAIANVTTVSGSGEFSAASFDTDGAMDAGSLEIGGTGVISAARAVSNVTSVAMGGALSGATTISGSGAISGLSLDIEKGADFNGGGLANAGAISGATTISGSGNVSGFAGDFESSVSALGGFAVGGTSIVSAARAVSNVTSIAMGGALSGATTISGSGEISGASIDVDGEVDAGSLEIGATAVITAARAVQNVTSVTMNGALAGATTVSASSNASFGGTLASSHGTFTVDADGDVSAKSLNVRAGGISNAGAIAGATTISGSGNVSGFAGDFESSVDALGGFAVGGSAIVTGGKAIQNVTSISGSGPVSAYSLNVDYGIDGGNGGITAAGAVSGVTTLSGSGAFQVGGSLSVANSGVNARDGYQVGGTGVISAARAILNVTSVSGSGNISGMAGDFESSVDALGGFAVGGTSVVAANRNLQNVNAVATNLLPDSNNSRNLGAATNKYAAVFATSLSGTNGEVDSMQVNSNLTVAGNLDVNGTVTTVDTVNLSIRDNFVLIASGANGSANNTNDQGFLFRRGSSDNDQAFIWDESADEFALIYDDSYDATATGNISFDGYSNLHVNSLVSENPLTEGIQSVAVDATATVSSAVVLAGSGSTLNMPASTSGYTYKLKNNDGGAGTKAITVNPNGSQKIDGASSVSIESDYGAIFLVGDGSNWYIL